MSRGVRYSGGPNSIDLSGTWRAAPLNGELHRTGADPDLDDDGWATVTVPGHWEQSEAFEDTDGPILYRRSFNGGEPREGERSWLVFDGVMAQSDVWLDGRFVGDTAGYFVPHRFDVTDVLRPDTDHTLAVEVSCPAPADERRKRSLTGSLQSGPLAPPGSPGGIWRPVRIETTGAVAIRWGRLLCTSASVARAELSLRLVLDANEGCEVRIDTNVTGPDGVAAAGGTESHTVARGENRIEWTTPIDLPSLWWPAALGEQPMYEVSVAVRDADGTVTDRRAWRTGLREVDVSDLRWTVNGERLFVKGVCIGPQDRHLGTVPTADLLRDLRSAQEAGLDLVRLHGHITRPEVYAEADRRGLLVWQDLPFVGGYSVATRKAARTVAREAVDLLGHHPSVAVWCAHEEPNGPPLPDPSPHDEPLQTTGRRLARHVLPSWNRSVLDPALRRELESNDPTRRVIRRSGSLPFLTDRSTSDPHLWLGWHTGQHKDLPEVIRTWPRLGSFLGGFGSQSVVDGDWDENEPTWKTAEVGSFERYLHRQAYADGESWAGATQSYQADLVRSQINTMRRLKYRPAGGFCLMSLFDAEASGGFGVLDSERRPKPAYEALVDACRPVVIIADTPPTITTPGSHLVLDVHAVSDLHHRIENVHATARAICGDWSYEQKWSGELPADACEHIGTLEFDVPAHTGLLVIDVELDTGDQVATNRSQTVVIPPAEANSRA